MYNSYKYVDNGLFLTDSEIRKMASEYDVAAIKHLTLQQCVEKLNKVGFSIKQVSY